MQTLMMLVRRNMRMYLSNRSGVFSSLFSMIIILLLNAVFLGSVNENYLAEFIILEENQAQYIIGSWLMAGIMIVNVVTVTMSTLSLMVEDEEKHKLAAFLVTPIHRTTLTLSYIIAACVNAFLLSIATFIFSQLYLYISCESLLSLSAALKICGVILIAIFSMVTLFVCVTILVHNMGTFSAISGTVGTLIGFIAGIYLPMGSLSENIQNVLKTFPVLYGAALVRQIYTEEAVADAFKTLPVEAMKGYKEYMGITIKWGAEEVSMLQGLFILFGSGIIFTVIAIILLKCKKASDR
ncbi:MAG: hypothetical protein E7231_10110 [Cellulosilyticum sp.]|nr:hypothetical protein [Cellulosilyticum sp.]